MVEDAFERVRLRPELVDQLGVPGEQLLGLRRRAARRANGRDAQPDLLLVLQRRGEDVAIGHQHHQLAFDVDGLVVVLEEHFVARVHLALVEHLVPVEQLDDRGRDQLRQRIDGVLEVEELALARFLLPLRRVVVAVEHDSLVLAGDLRQQLGDRRVQLFALGDGALEVGGDRVERVGHRHVQHRVRPGDVLARRHGAELELVAGEGKRAGAVAVARVARQLRQNADAHVERAALLG